MTTQANIGRWKFRLGDQASPELYQDIEEVFSISGLGKTNQLEDVTNFDSPVGTMEYIAGLADGSEITIECNRIPDASPNTEQENMIAAVNAQLNRNFQIAYVGVSPEETFTFVGVPLSWTVTPSPTNRNTITFTVKISGDIT
jgi:hypothetical protein